MDRLPFHGLLVNIRKCFNAIARLPLWKALTQLGFPLGVLRAWVAFASGQATHFRVRGSVGDPLCSCSGLPEGCAMGAFTSFWTCGFGNWMLPQPSMPLSMIGASCFGLASTLIPCRILSNVLLNALICQWIWARLGYGVHRLMPELLFDREWCKLLRWHAT